MFDCIGDECFENSSNDATTKKVAETYPSVAYVMMYSYNGAPPQIFGGVFESEYDAQQYCIDNSTSSKNFYYYVGIFKPPGTGISNNANLQATKGPNYPNYVYPTATRHDPNTYWDPQPPYVFANENDASDFVALHSNVNATIQYSIQNWIPSSTYNYSIHGFVGHKFFRHIAPTRVQDYMPAMQR